jgi:DNA-directed RNA polymerase subunit RPC12/RpoP
MAKTKQEWMCPKCGNRVLLFIKPLMTPNCRNYEKHHSTRYTEMRLVNDGQDDQ